MQLWGKSLKNKIKNVLGLTVKIYLKKIQINIY